MIDEATSLLSAAILLLGCGVWPVAFLFAGCAPCCRGEDPCPRRMTFDRCILETFLGEGQNGGSDSAVVLDLETSTTSTGTPPPNGNNVRIAGMLVRRLPLKIRVGINLEVYRGAAAVGETKSQLWRYIVPPQPSQFDVVGPAWFLEVEISVTGVATKEEEGLDASIVGDGTSQPRLVFDARIWTQGFLSTTQTVTVACVGLQRWLNVPFSATLVEGENSLAWRLTRGTVQVSERGYVLDNNAAGQVRRVFLDQQAVDEFLSGDSPLILQAQAGTIFDTFISERRVEVLPQSVLCGQDALNMRTGVALGIYEPYAAADGPEELEEDYCLDTVTFPLTATLSQGAGWSFSDGYSPPFSLRANWYSGTVDIPLSSFYAGSTLLWNAINGPYRTSYEGTGPNIDAPMPGIEDLGKVSEGWTYRLGQEPSTLEDDYRGPRVPICPPGYSIAGDAVCAQDSITVDISGSQQFVVVKPNSLLPPDEWAIAEGWENVVMTATLQQQTVVMNLQGTEPQQVRYDTLDGNSPNIYGSTYSGVPGGVELNVLWFVTARFPITCPFPQPGALTLSNNVTLFRIDGLSPSGLALRRIGDVEYPQVTELDPVIGAIPRVVCSPWSPSTVPHTGGTISRSCSYLFRGTAFQTFTQSEEVPPSNSLLPRSLYVGEVTQAGSCSLLGVAVYGSTTLASGTILISSANVGQCLFYSPIFGAIPGTPSASDVGPTTVPCVGCTTVVTVTNGVDLASAIYYATGDKAGGIEVSPKRAWRFGEGITLAITCGNDTITQTIKRQDGVPSAPENLAVVRGPCSQATLSWEEPWNGGREITSYIIQYRIINAGSYQTYNTVPAASLSASVFDLLRLGYDFRVAAINALGTGEYATVTDGFALGAPTNLSFTRTSPNCGTVNLTWTPPTQSECVVVASYRLEYRDASTFGEYTLAATVDGSETSGSISGLPTDVRLEFRVGRVDDANTTVYSGTVTSGNFPFRPTGGTATLGENAGEVNLAWNAQETECFENTDYNIQIYTTAWADFDRTPSAAKSATITGLAPGLYFFRVRAVNAVGVSSFSSAWSITIP